MTNIQRQKHDALVETLRAVVAERDALLAVLERIVAAWESIPPGDDVPEALNLDGMWAVARDTIARAKGGHP